jgi:hypothetical protein
MKANKYKMDTISLGMIHQAVKEEKGDLGKKL